MNLFPYSVLLSIGLSLNCLHPQAQTNFSDTSPQIRGEKQLFIPLYRFEPRKLKYRVLTAAHANNLPFHNRYDELINTYWAKVEQGQVFHPTSVVSVLSIGKGLSSVFPSKGLNFYHTIRKTHYLLKY